MKLLFGLRPLRELIIGQYPLQMHSLFIQLSKLDRKCVEMVMVLTSPIERGGESRLYLQVCELHQRPTTQQTLQILISLKHSLVHHTSNHYMFLWGLTLKKTLSKHKSDDVCLLLL